MGGRHEALCIGINYNGFCKNNGCKILNHKLTDLKGSSKAPGSSEGSRIPKAAPQT